MHLLLVGCGHLGQTMLRRWLALDQELRFTIIKPTPLGEEFGHANIAWHATLPTGLSKPHAILYAVRPQQLAQVLPTYRDIAQDTTNISVAAGWSLAKFALFLGDAPLIRTMPNLPSQIGQGITPAIASAACDAAARQTAERLFGLLGQLAWLETEAQMDAATALSGSGPAYVFLLAAAMREAGIKLGLGAALATDLSRATVQGAGNYLAQPGMDIATLYRGMLLPGGTTEAAMTRLLADDGMTAMLQEAMRRAVEKAREIGLRPIS